MFKDLSLETRNLQTKNCASTQCTVWPRNAWKIFFFVSSKKGYVFIHVDTPIDLHQNHQQEHLNFGAQ